MSRESCELDTSSLITKRRRRRRSSRSNTKSVVSPHQGMHTHTSYFIFYPNFFHLFSLSTIRENSLESQTRLLRKSGTSKCVIAHGSYSDKFCFLLGFLLCWKDICFLISVFDCWFLYQFLNGCWFLIFVFWFLIMVVDFWYLFSNFW